MNNTEAIEALKMLKRTVKEESDSDKAIDLAISALKFKDRYDQFWEEVKSAGMRGEEVEIHHSGRIFRIREVA